MFRSSLTALGALALLACARRGAPAFLVLDEGAGVLATLDERLLVLAQEPLAGARLLSGDGQSSWGTRRVDAGPGGQARLFRRGAAPDGRELAFGELVALVPDGQGGVFALDRLDPARTRLWQVEPWLERHFLAEFPGGARLAVSGRELLLASESGTLWRLRRDGAVLASTDFSAPVAALAAGPEPESWYVLGDGATPCVARLERTLSVRWSVALFARARACASEQGRERLWLVEGERLVAFGAGGWRVLALALPARGGPYRPCLARDGRVWLAGVGALLEIDSAGTRAWIARSQGGFDALAGLVRCAGAAGPPPGASSRRATRP